MEAASAAHRGAPRLRPVGEETTMPHGACRRCHQLYALNAASRFQPLCPRCGERLRRLSAREERRLSDSGRQLLPATEVTAARAPGPPARTSEPAKIDSGLSLPGFQPPGGKGAAALDPAGRWLRGGAVVAALGLGLAGIGFFAGAFSRRAAPPRLQPRRLLRAGLHQQRPFGRALWEARWYRSRAIQAVNQERAALLERLPPEESARRDQESWRRRLMAADRSGDLQRARQAGLRAAALARTPREKYEAALWLDLIESDAGHPQAEREQARRMMALDPANPLSKTALQRAASNLIPGIGKGGPN